MDQEALPSPVVAVIVAALVIQEEVSVSLVAVSLGADVSYTKPLDIVFIAKSI